MGFQDRGYSSRGFGAGAAWTAVGGLLAATVAVFIANMLGPRDPASLNDLLALDGDLPRQPWRAWELVTYGFAHSMPRGGALPWHIIGNMLTLWFFGRAVEDVLGRAEFLRFYVTALVVAGLAWLAGEALRPSGGNVQLVGASGAVTAVLAVFIWHYPHQTVLLWGILPVPAWALGVLYFVFDVQGATDSRSNVAHVAHLAGAAFGMLYAWRGWSLAGLGDLPARLAARRRGRGLRVLRPDDDGGDDATLQQQVDRILEKISRSGSASLTQHERDTLERASRRLKDRDRA
ncbi:MAG: rhomboid family intramembrane serine protease [Planctomycetaceae bacterium]